MTDSTPPADDRTPAGYDPDGTPYYPTTVGQLGLCGPRSDDTSVGPDAARHTPDAGDRPPRDFPAEGSFAVTRSVGSLRVWGDRRWRWDGHDWQPVAPAPPVGDQATRAESTDLLGKLHGELLLRIPPHVRARAELAEAERRIRHNASMPNPKYADERLLLAEYDRRGTELAGFAWAEMLTEQTCTAGKHATWYVDSEHHHACPWCEIDRLRDHILDIDAHATPDGDIPDDPGYAGVYLVTAGALHRALGRVGHTSPSCTAEARVAAVRALADTLDQEVAALRNERTRHRKWSTASALADAASRIRAALDGPAEAPADGEPETTMCRIAAQIVAVGSGPESTIPPRVVDWAQAVASADDATLASHFAGPAEAVEPAPLLPRRDDHVAAWIKAAREAWAGEPSDACPPEYHALDDLLDDYRLHADTGTPLGQHACEGPYCCGEFGEDRVLAPALDVAREVVAAIDRLHLQADQLTLVVHPATAEVGERVAGIPVLRAPAVSPGAWMLRDSDGRSVAGGGSAERASELVAVQDIEAHAVAHPVSSPDKETPT